MIRHLRLTFLLVVFVVPFSVQAQRDPPVDQIELRSSLLGRTISYRILYPVQYQYAEKREKRFPVLYLLHGVTGHSSNWLEKTRLALYATQYDLFIVLVEGGNGWYTDSATAPADKYESYILKELIPDVEKRFRVSQERAGRAVAGLSMGGYGAVKFGLKYPQMFGFVASMSGAFGAPSRTDKELKDFGTIRESLFQTFGAADSPTRRANDVFKLTRELRAEQISSLPFIYLDCGTDDLLFPYSRELAGLFVDRKIPHEYRQLPGTHDWQYWDMQIREILRLTAQRLDPPK
jgi:putative tributyrin esterase